ncbi:hypothetical protein GCM10022240_07630 [Microbacterium kribbense]|uniref:GmrSD restriction endonucleases C-terminal domain-containing protein n=2 Tax=Microbacterium kribbense TaxID=433645 RepID=A0ABP7G7M6_9MICO
MWRRPTLWVGAALSAVLLLSAGLSTGVGGLLMSAGLIALVSGLYTLLTRRPSWLGLAGRKAGALVTVLACAAVLTGTGVYGATGGMDAAPQPAAEVVSAPPSTGFSATPTPTPSPTATATPSPSAGTALALLATVPVKGRAPKTGYDRPVVFGQAWKDVDRNGCDTRNDILRRDLTHVTVKAGTHGCLVLSGILNDPYTGATISFVRGEGTSNAVQIDHVVALMDAWQSGAQQLSQPQREALANDPLNLLAVDGPSNERKQASNAASWLPPNRGYRCAYVARQITVKAAYHLWVTAAEHDAMARILQTCPAQKPATAGTIALLPNAVAPAPAPTQVAPAEPAPTKSAPASPKVVHPGSFCSPVGATGVTVKGTPMTCSLTAGDTRARWRAA